jgi:hypothetical protein
MKTHEKRSSSYIDENWSGKKKEGKSQVFRVSKVYTYIFRERERERDRRSKSSGWVGNCLWMILAWSEGKRGET